MPEIMPFGKYKGLSVEQIVLQDYKYFNYVLGDIPLKKNSLKERFEYVDQVVNNFVSQELCRREGCNNPARLISIYHSHILNERSSSPEFIYCSEQCFDQDPMVTSERQKVSLEPLKFRSAFSSTKYDTNELIKLMARCMGLKEGRKTKEYLEDFFNTVNIN